jgi:hypothetical protein
MHVLENVSCFDQFLYSSVQGSNLIIFSTQQNYYLARCVILNFIARDYFDDFYSSL